MPKDQLRPISCGSQNHEPKKSARSCQRVGILGAVLLLLSYLYLFIIPDASKPAEDAWDGLLYIAMQWGFFASYALLLVAATRAARAGPASVLVGLVTHGYVLIVSLQFFRVPQGADIRPMGFAMFVFLISFVCFVIVAGLCIQNARKDRAYGWIIMALPLGVSPFFVGSGVLHLAARINGFTLAP